MISITYSFAHLLIYASLSDFLWVWFLQGLSPLTEGNSFASECSLSDEGSLAESQSSGGGKMKSKISSKLGKDGRICAVCGDKALGCNFDAISCESCKAFFRRNASKDSVRICIYANCL